MALAGTNIPLITQPEGRDKITQTEKVTTPYFSDGTATLLAASLSTSSLSDTNEKYFFGISDSTTPTTTEFNIAFGSSTGYGGAKDDTKSKTEAIYKQYSNLLLAPTEVTGGFFISSLGSAGKLTAKDENIFIMSSTRTNMKDRLNKGTWTIQLSGSNTAGDGTSTTFGQAHLNLTDDSISSKPTATPVGDRYNIVSGSAGTVTTGQGASVRTFGFFYPDMGIMVLSQAELSASIPGKGANKNDTVIFGNTNKTQHGFGLGTGTGGTNKNIALRLANCLQTPSSKLTFRDEEDTVSAQYFCRVYSGDCNFSNNPTFVSGSFNELRNSKMKGNPQTFITSVQLYNNSGDIVAVGNLSTPLKKNFTSEATIKVKLTY